MRVRVLVCARVRVFTCGRIVCTGNYTRKQLSSTCVHAASGAGDRQSHTQVPWMPEPIVAGPSNAVYHKVRACVSRSSEEPVCAAARWLLYVLLLAEVAGGVCEVIVCSCAGRLTFTFRVLTGFC